MNLDSKEEVVPGKNKKLCTFCLFVRYFAVFAFLLTVVFYFYTLSQQKKISQKVNAVEQVTMEADIR